MRTKSVVTAKGPVDSNKQAQQAKQDANLCVGAGVGLGLLGALAAAGTGAVCPACVIVAPALVGTGIYQRIRCGKVSSDSVGASPLEVPSVDSSVLEPSVSVSRL